MIIKRLYNKKYFCSDFLMPIKKSLNYLISGINTYGILKNDAYIYYTFSDVNLIEEINMETPSKNEPIKSLKKQAALSKNGILVENAGIVLLNNFIDILFHRLKLTEEKKFTSTENQIKAVHCLQYLVTGLTYTDQDFLSLNKILCGLSVNDTISNEFEMSEEKRSLIDGLLYAAIGYWPEAKDSSLTGFRGNWLIREGNLLELEDKWELTVQKRAYDILLRKSPFYFSIVKYPWMNKPLHVIWHL